MNSETIIDNLSDKIIQINKNSNTNTQYIYKILKCISLLEERVGIETSSMNNNGESTSYRKYQCKYCKCKMNSSYIHDHEDEKSLIQSIKSIAFNNDRSNVDFTHEQEEEEEHNVKNVLDTLPTVVIDELFKHCTHKTLINISNAYPKYFHIALNPIYWKYIKIDLSENLFNQIELLTLFMHLNQYLRRLSFKDSFNLNPNRLSLYFDYTPNLTHLELGRVNSFNVKFIDMIVKKLKYLIYLNFEWNSKTMYDEHLIKLLDLKYLHSIDLSQCTYLTNNAVLMFVRNIKKLVYFNIDGIQYLNDDTIQEICQLHSSTLENLIVDGEEQSDEAFNRIDQCKILKELRISFAKQLTSRTIEKLSKLNKLESLTIRHTNLNEPKTFETLFKNSLFSKMKILHLEKCDSIDDEALKYLPKCFPILEELYLPWCWEISECGLEYVVLDCNSLKNIDLTGLNGVTGEVFQYVPNMYLKNIQYINLTYCRGVSSTKPLFKNILEHHPAILLIDYYNNPMTLEQYKTSKTSNECDEEDEENESDDDDDTASSDDSNF